MKSALRLTGFVLVSAAALLLAGCGKKPQRPNPYQTMMGQGPGDGLNPEGLTTDLDSSLEQRVPIGADDLDRTTLQANTVYFDFDSAAIRVAERAKLAQAAEYLKANAGARVILEGHCDWRGTTEYNMGLGDRRAGSVRDYLGTLGIPAGQLETLSKGDLDAKEGASDSEMQRDRRVDLVLRK